MGQEGISKRKGKSCVRPGHPWEGGGGRGTGRKQELYPAAYLTAAHLDVSDRLFKGHIPEKKLKP